MNQRREDEIAAQLERRRDLHRISPNDVEQLLGTTQAELARTQQIRRWRLAWLPKRTLPALGGIAVLVLVAVVVFRTPLPSADRALPTDVGSVPNKAALPTPPSATDVAPADQGPTAAAIADVPLWTRPPPAEVDGVPMCPGALGGGRLAPHPGSGLGVTDASGEVEPIYWPFGYTARQEAGGIVLIDAEGRVVAREGDLVSFGGGLYRGNVFAACTEVEAIDSADPGRAEQTIECGRHDDDRCQAAIDVVAAEHPAEVASADAIVVDDTCSPRGYCDRFYPFSSLVVLVVSHPSAEPTYYLVVGEDDWPERVEEWNHPLPKHILELVASIRRG